MHSFLRRRHRLDLVLDALFALWVLHVLVTGSFVPGVVSSLLHNERPVVAATDPESVPTQPQELQPGLPETGAPLITLVYYS